MPDWTGSFHMPHLTTEEFLQERTKYVAKYGYRYSIPGFDDVVRLNIEKPITEEETKIWKNKQFSELSPERFEELKYMKKQRTEAYLDMLGSPQPHIFQSRGSLIGAIDDAQDALATLATVGAIAIRALPAAVKALLGGPVGALMTASEILSLFNSFLTPERAMIKSKRLIEQLKDKDPLATKVKVKGARKIRTAKIGRGTVIEALQVTENMFGIGISLGAVMNVPFDIVFATARSLPGLPPIPKLPIPDIPHWKARGMKLLKAAGTLLSAGGGTYNQDYTQLLIAANAAGQVQNYQNRDWHPFDEIPNVNEIQIQAPKVKNILSIEAITEVDAQGLDAIKWPSTGEEWSTVDDLVTTMPDPINKSFKSYTQKTQYAPEGLLGPVNATEATLHILEAAEGPGSVVIDYTADTKAITGLTNAGYTFPRSLTSSQFNRWMLYTDSCEAQGIAPTLKGSLNHARNIAGFEFVKQFSMFS